MDIKHLSDLAQLSIAPEKVVETEAVLKKILKYFDEISGVDTQGIVPLLSPLDEVLTLREDEVNVQLSTEDVFKNSPESQGKLFKVPPVV